MGSHYICCSLLVLALLQLAVMLGEPVRKVIDRGTDVHVDEQRAVVPDIDDATEEVGILHRQTRMKDP